MSITASLALGKGLSVNIIYGSLLGGAIGYMAGKMSEYNPQSKFAEHLKRFGDQLSSDHDLSLGFYEKEKDYSSPRTNYIDYETSKREFCKVHNDNNYHFDNYYRNNSRFESPESPPIHYYGDLREKYNIKEKSNTYNNNYYTDNYTSNYDIENYTKEYD